MVSDIREKIGAANTEVVNSLAASNPVLGDMLPAGGDAEMMALLDKLL
jgi:hypothetical protein